MKCIVKFIRPLTVRCYVAAVNVRPDTSVYLQFGPRERAMRFSSVKSAKAYADRSGMGKSLEVVVQP